MEQPMRWGAMVLLSSGTALSRASWHLSRLKSTNRSKAYWRAASRLHSLASVERCTLWACSIGLATLAHHLVSIHGAGVECFVGSSLLVCMDRSSFCTTQFR